uniref:Transcription initiation factor TFIID subunit 7 n=1 Tax=Aceria tosichella TaxID=561515 RepID=A0A6G1SNN5_9ACAR
MSSDHKLELESQFILRLPPAKADTLRQAIKSGEPLSQRLFIKFDNDIRHGHIKLDDSVMPARLYDLPAIIESYKTLDRKNFYKTADISQIMICKEDDSPDGKSVVTQDGVDEETKKARYDQIFASIGCAGKREYLYPHGITPPLKNVRKRRFRKTLKKKYVDFSEIEKEVKRLFKFDCEAIDSRYEILEENKVDKVQPTTFSTENPASPMSGGGPAGMQSAENSQNIDINELFGEELSSSDDSDDDDDDDEADDDIEEQENDKDLDHDDNMDFDEQEEQPAQAPEPTTATVADIAAEVAAASDLIAQNDDNEERKQELNRELSKIRERIQIQESEMMGLDNQALRMRSQLALDSLHEQENEIRKQLEECSTQM